jgi:hypothetical protein
VEQEFLNLSLLCSVRTTLFVHLFLLFWPLYFLSFGRHSAVALLLKAALIQVSDYRLLGASGLGKAICMGTKLKCSI